MPTEHIVARHTAINFHWNPPWCAPAAPKPQPHLGYHHTRRHRRLLQGGDINTNLTELINKCSPYSFVRSFYSTWTTPERRREKRVTFLWWRAQLGVISCGLEFWTSCSLRNHTGILFWLLLQSPPMPLFNANQICRRSSRLEIQKIEWQVFLSRAVLWFFVSPRDNHLFLSSFADTASISAIVCALFIATFSSLCFPRTLGLVFLILRLASLLRSSTYYQHPNEAPPSWPNYFRLITS